MSKVMQGSRKDITSALDRIIKQQTLNPIASEQAHYFEENIEKARVFMEKLES